jgi:hypothetical protein
LGKGKAKTYLKKVLDKKYLKKLLKKVLDKKYLKKLLKKVFYLPLYIMVVHGISAKGVLTSENTMLRSRDRFVLRKAWNGNMAKSMYMSRGRVATPFRAAMNAGDFLGRKSYSCGGGTQTNASKPGYGLLIGSIRSNCDNSGIAPATCNGKFVYDSSTYTTFKRHSAKQRNYNDTAL